MESEPIPKSESQRGGISYRLLIAVVLSFIGGIVALLLFTKVASDSQITFSVTGIISFIFGIALSSASIVLAITAISLGRASERTMVERSDQSIRLQNDVFVKTTEALGRIESSTGTTEKRIEDIIAGRAGAIADRLTEHRRLGPRNREEIEKEIRESIFAELPQGRVRITTSKAQEETEVRKASEREAAWVKYRKFKDAFLIHIADQPSTKSRKIGEGHYGALGEDLADGVFETSSGRIAVCAFSTNPVLSDNFGATSRFGKFVDAIISELASGTFQRVLFSFDEKLDEGSPFMEQLESRRAFVKNELYDRIVILGGEFEEIIEAVTKEFVASQVAE